MVFFSLIFLQKIGLGSGDPSISISIPVLYLVLAILCERRCIHFSVWRLILFTTFVVFALISQVFVSHSISVLSIMFIFVLYLPFTVVWCLREDEWLRIVSVFQDMMVLPAVMVFVQLAWQNILHLSPLSIEPFIPRVLVMGGFMYQGPIQWGHPLLRPNGFFMLEPSFISAYAASALVLEASTFRRLPRMALYGASLVASTGATGLVLTAVAAPFVLARQAPGVILLTLLVLVVGGAVAVETGLTNPLIHPLSELQTQGSSGYGRLTSPLNRVGEILNDPDSLFTGMGAGSTSRMTVDSLWPLVKLGLEYGLPTLVSFLIFNIACFWGAPVPGLAAGCYVVFNFTGGYLQNPLFVILIFLLVASVRIKAEGADDVVRRPGTSRANNPS